MPALSVSNLSSSLQDIQPSQPLWKRAPTKDDNGKPVSDFMMLIPKLNKQSPEVIKNTVEAISLVLGRYHETVVFADLNMKINILWVSVRAVPGICLELPVMINHAVPAAKLVGEKHPMKK